MIPKESYLYLMLSIYTQQHHPSYLRIPNILAKTITPILITPEICFQATDITSTIALIQHPSPYRAFLYFFSNFSHISSLYSSVVERQSCKLKVLGSIPSGGCLVQTWDSISHDGHAYDLWRYWLHILFSFYETTPTVGLEPTTTRLRALRSTDWARRAWSLCWGTIATT